jgi:hypothetical protein
MFSMVRTRGEQQLICCTLTEIGIEFSKAMYFLNSNSNVKQFLEIEKFCQLFQHFLPMCIELQNFQR